MGCFGRVLSIGFALAGTPLNADSKLHIVAHFFWSQIHGDWEKSSKFA